MKASELVALLNAEIEKYGDLEVKYFHEVGFDVTPCYVTTYDYHGNIPTEANEATETYIH